MEHVQAVHAETRAVPGEVAVEMNPVPEAVGFVMLTLPKKAVVLAQVESEAPVALQTLVVAQMDFAKVAEMIVVVTVLPVTVAMAHLVMTETLDIVVPVKLVLLIPVEVGTRFVETVLVQ